MNRNSNLETSLDKWLHGEISSEMVLTEVEKDGTQDSRSVMNAHKAAYQGLKNAYIIQHIKDIHQEFAEVEKPIQIRKVLDDKTFPIKKLLSIAASIIIIIGLFLGYNNIYMSKDDLYNQFYNEYYLINERGDEATLSDPLAESFNSKNYPEVLQILSGIEYPERREKFLGGFSAFMLDDDALAQKLFNEIIKGNSASEIKLYQDESEYFLALSYMRNNDYENALHLFEKIKANPFHIYYEKVSGLNIFRLKVLNFF